MKKSENFVKLYICKSTFYLFNNLITIDYNGLKF